MTTNIIIISISISLISSFIFSVLWIKFNTEIQNFWVDRSKGLYDRVKKQLADVENETVLLVYLQRIWYKTILNYIVVNLSFFIFIISFNIYLNIKVYKYIPLIISIIFSFLFFLKLNHVAKYYNIERIVKKYLEDEKKLKVFETNIFWK